MSRITSFKEIRNLTKNDIVIIGEILDCTRKPIGYHGYIKVDEGLLEELGAYTDWEKEQMFSDEPSFPFRIYEQGNVEIKLCVATYSTAPLNMYVQNDFVDELAIKVKELCKELLK